jgi:uncharacterized protein
MYDLEKFHAEAQSKAVGNKKFLQSLKRKPADKVDEWFAQSHEEVFEQLDCLQCANCCKTTSPIFTKGDVERLARTLGMRPAVFEATYLTTDADGDKVLRAAPCPFLLPDNRCMVYEDRPKACREYPHTNRKKMQQILTLTYRNTLVCPAVLQVVERIKDKAG